MKAFLTSKKPTKYCWAKEQNPDGSGVHYHVAMAFAEGMSTTNKAAWRTALLKNCTLEYPDVALDIRHEYCYVRYLGYVSKDEDIIELFNTEPSEVAEGRRLESMRKITMEGHKLMRDLRFIRKGALTVYRVWASQYTGFDGGEDGKSLYLNDAWLAEHGWTTDEYGWNPGTLAVLKYVQQPH